MIWFGAASSLFAWYPGTGSPNAVENFTVDTTNRTDVLAFYNTVYSASGNYAAEMAWNGDVANDVPGTTTSPFKDDVQRRINLYRALVGLPATITFDDTNSSNDQYAALMFSSNNAISHTPPTTWSDYSAAGATAAGHSNIAIGYYGPGSVDAYMVDFGGNNTEVGHRRWLLYSQALVMGTGDIPPNGSYNPANAIWVDTTTSRTVTPMFEKWPNAGYCPFPLMPARWSVSYPNADFTQATVTMTQGATSIPCTIIYSDSNASNGGSFIGDNTLVWEPSNLPTSISSDTTFTVTVSGILNVSGITSLTYNVTVFDPNVLGQSVTISGTTTPPSSGATYTFNSIDQADAYDLQVSTGSTAAWTEGAEDSPTPQITSSTTGSYILRQTGVKRTGAKAFQFAFPADVDSNNQAESYDFSDQSFEVTRQIIPTGSSQLQFWDLCRFATTTATLSAQVSADNGLSWTQVWSRAGVGGSSTNWDTSFIQNNVDVSSYAGKVILVRFVLSSNGGSIYPGTTSSYGFFLDDVTITNATQLTNITDTSLAGSATTFGLTPYTAGAALQAGVTYYLRVSPEVGLKFYGYGSFKLVTPTTTVSTSYSNWISSLYPTVTEGVSGNHTGDGIPNGLKYAFGLDPTVHSPPNAIPAPQILGSNLVLSYTGFAAGVTYGAQTSTDQINWTAVTDTGTNGNHLFTVSTTGHPHIFLRNSITITP